MTSRIFALILGAQTPTWDVPSPPDYPRRTLGWYLERARCAQAEREQHGNAPLEVHWHVVRDAQRIIDEAPRND
jgi:hypothetical protein